MKIEIIEIESGGMYLRLSSSSSSSSSSPSSPPLSSSSLNVLGRFRSISLMYTLVDHPASNRIVEGVNQTITNRLRQKIIENAPRFYQFNYLMIGNDPVQLFQDHPLETNRFIAFNNSMMSHEY
ncbi:hypothetical protein SSS_03006 [Sarcoptes scabiei]|uniref:Uncharacterized protein n=1 Tax=Sarcoptes scabiei TaxID=52283 RepID=A0A834VDW9_SARSC|nr:hypothetical protein SSS_03006 [Sarcoptes scabiei]